MMYAASKLQFLNAVESEIGLEIAKKVKAVKPPKHFMILKSVQLEASSPSEITESVIEDEFRPKQEESKGFARPKRPGKRS